MKFWLFVAAAVLAVLAGVRDLYNTVHWWGVPYRICGPNCVATAPSSSQGVLGVSYIVGMFALGAALAWLAARARRTP